MEKQNTALFGAYIRLMREARGWSLRELAAQAGISHTTVDNIEKGYDPRTGRDTNTTLDTLYHLSDALSLPVSHLLACLDGSARVTLARHPDTWEADLVEDMEHERGGVREYLRLKWGKGQIDFPTAATQDAEAIAKAYLFGSLPPTDAEWEQVKQYAAFLQNK